MQVLLIKDVDNLGYAGAVKKVANGFGRNYLLPQGMAVLATPGALKQAGTISKVAEKQRAQLTEDAKAISAQLENLTLVFERRSGETGKLYGSVTSGDIADAIAEKTEIEIDKRKVALAEPIRSLGLQNVPIKLMIDVTTAIGVEVVPLGGILERERLDKIELAQAEAEAKTKDEAAVEVVPEVEVEAAVEVVPEVEVEAAVEVVPEVEVEAEVEAAPEVEADSEVEVEAEATEAEAVEETSEPETA